MRLQHWGGGGNVLNNMYEEAAVLVLSLPWIYLDGSPQERQEVAAHGQQDEHAVEVEAGGWSSGPGQSMLDTKTAGQSQQKQGVRIG